MFSTNSQPKRTHPFLFVTTSLPMSPFRSDPVIEPMLQSIPDPFDSYGPPQAEDQIFSILQPLSISANAPSPSPSPMNASPPETAKADNNLAGKSAWAPSNEYFPTTEGVSQWADIPSPSSTPPISSTPPRSASPPAAAVRRKQSHPPSSVYQPRKSGSKLKSVLPVVDENLTRHDHSDDTNNTSSLSALNGNTQIPDKTWGSFSYGQSPYEAFGGSDDTTPQHSRHPSLYSQPSVPAFDPDPPRGQSEPTAHVPLPT